MDHFVRPGLRFDVADSGPADAPAVVLLHGFPQQPFSFDAVAGRLNAVGCERLRRPNAATRPLLDRPGAGTTELLPRPPMSSPCWTLPAWPKRTLSVMTGVAARPGGRPAGTQIGSSR